MAFLNTLVLLIGYIVIVPYVARDVRRRGIKILLFGILVLLCVKLGIEAAVAIVGIPEVWENRHESLVRLRSGNTI